MRRLLIILPLVLLVSLSLSTAACGGDDDDAGPLVTTTSTPVDSGDGSAEDGQTDRASPTDDDDDSNGEIAETPVGASGQNACDLISSDEIEEITDVGFDDGEQTVDGCSFENSGGDYIAIVLQHFPGQAEQKFDSFVGLDLLGFEEIDGTGERAAWSEDSGELLILTGDDLVSVIVFYQPGHNAVPRDDASFIAEIVLGRFG